MTLSVRFLETSPQKFHPLQILFARQSITSLGCFFWMWYNAVPDAPLGPRGSVRWLLVLRGIGGFWGVFGMYCSLMYLDLSDATVITFLTPIVTSFVCSVIPALKEPFTKHELFAGIVSLLGVVLIARPASLFPVRGEEADIAARSILPPKAAPQQRALAVLMGLVGVLGATSAYTTIRWIGKRAHPLISVNYLATWSTIVSVIGLVVMPQVGGIVWPATLRQW
jgi:drug/metabolite transporter (DMT)-like permease